MDIHGWPRCCVRAAVGAATAPSVLAPSCDASRTGGAAAAATLARPPQQDFGVCVSLSSFDRLPADRLNRSTGQKLEGRPLGRRRLRDLERSNIILVATLIRRLVDLQHHKNVVVD